MFLLHMWFHLMTFMYKRSVLLLPFIRLKSHQFGLPHMSLYLNGLFVICYFVFDRLVYFGQVAGGLLVVLETTAIIKMLRLITIHF